MNTYPNRAKKKTTTIDTYSLLLLSLLLVALGALGPVGSLVGLNLGSLLVVLSSGVGGLALVGGSDYVVVRSEGACTCQRSVSAFVC